MSEKSLAMRAAFEKPRPPVVGKRGAKVSESVFQVSWPSGLRYAGTRILAEEPRPATTAVGTSRQGRVVIRRLAERLIGQFRQLAQRSERLDILSGCAVSAGVVRIKSTQARLDSSRFEGCQSP